MHYSKTNSDKKELLFTFKNYDEWLQRNIQMQKFEEKSSENWSNFFVKHIDYLANPSILMKNFAVVETFLSTWLPELNEDGVNIREIKEKIELLHKKCYDFDL